MNAKTPTPFRHRDAERQGLLLVNLGTPDAPTAGAVRRFLRQFLSDGRVVEIPRALWFLILNLFILPLRPARVAKAYQKIWLKRGSPLAVHSRELTQAVERELEGIEVELAMTYGNPSMERAVEALMQRQVRELVVLPLYPQYSATTSAAAFDRLAGVLRKHRHVPGLRLIRHYCDDAGYINALAESIKAHRSKHATAQRLVFSFHGIPERNHLAGDPYPCQCRKTARLVAEALDLSDDQWEIAFQSRFGKQKWIEPYLDQRLRDLPGEGVTSVDVICPGFATDCLETLEEVAIENSALFVEHGGIRLNYVPALNASAAHAGVIADLARKNLLPFHQSDPERRALRAIAVGAGE